MAAHMKIALIAPCGMNCGICLAYLRNKNHCPGCRMPDEGKNQSCIRCAIKNCEKFKDEKTKYCFECEEFPCAKVKHLDKRYRTRYGMSMIENLQTIRQLGIQQFVRNEGPRWACTNCGGVICVHRPFCPHCGEKIDRPMTIARRV